MSQSRSKIVRRLTLAQQEGQPVTVRRKHLEADQTPGFVVAVTDRWVVLQELDGVHLDTVVLLRLDHVTKVERHDGHAYVSRAVAGLGVPLAEFECPADVTTEGLLRLVVERAELICVYLETRDDYWLLIGKTLRIGKKRLHLHFIGRDGVWTDFTESWKLKDITRIEFGGRYIGALEQFGEPMPKVEKHVKR